MTKRDYELIASVLKRAHSRALHIKTEADLLTLERTLQAIADDFATVLKADNPRFDAVRFLTACGMA